MSVLWDILQFSIGSLFWGVLIAAVCMLLFYLAIKGWWKNAAFTPVTYIVGAVLFVLLSVQCILICGAIKIISFTDVVEQRTEEILASRHVFNVEVPVSESEDIVQELLEEYPIFRNYFDYGYFEGYTVATLPAAVGDEIRNYLCEFIVRRLLWCLGFVVVSAFIAVKTISFNNGSGGRSRESSARRQSMSVDRSRPRISGHSRVRRTR